MSVPINVIAPVLGRPLNAQPLADSFRASSPDARLTFVCSPGDTDQIDACYRTGELVLVTHWEPAGGDYARKIQLGFDATEEPYVLCAADDLRFHVGWDRRLLEVVDVWDVGVVGTNDLVNSAVMAGRHATHPLVSRCYIDSRGGYVGGVGRVYFDGYDHQMVDVELVETALQRGCYAHCHASLVEHLHPIFNRAVADDATYRKGQARGGHDRALFESRRHLWLNERKAVTA